MSKYTTDCGSNSLIHFLTYTRVCALFPVPEWMNKLMGEVMNEVRLICHPRNAEETLMLESTLRIIDWGNNEWMVTVNESLVKLRHAIISDDISTKSPFIPRRKSRIFTVKKPVRCPFTTCSQWTWKNGKSHSPRYLRSREATVISPRKHHTDSPK